MLRRGLFAIVFAWSLFGAQIPCGFANEREVAFQLQLDPGGLDGLSDKDQAVLVAFLRDAEAKLPSKLKAAIGKAVPVRFAELSPGTKTLPGCRGESANSTQGGDFVLGETNGRKVRLNSLLIPEILSGPTNATRLECGHQDYYRQALAALLHEVSHVYDRLNLHPSEVTDQIEWCQRHYDQATGYSPGGCAEALKLDRTISSDPLYMTLAGWTETGFILRSRAQHNTFKVRSPDEYEFADVKEHFAVNMEFFLLDPDYACRRPALHKYLSRHFGADPYPDRKCSVSDRGVSVSVASDGSVESHLVPLDRSRLYQVHYLFAGQGDSMMSRWGHAMYRLVFCAPERSQVGPECLEDISSHWVVSFRANIAETSIDSWSGIVGRYPSQMFLLPLIDVVSQYTDGELRDVTSLPLRLTEDEKSDLLDRVLELQWTYRGKYFFFSNNCATESLNLLRGASARSRIQNESVNSPLGLYELLVASGLGDREAIVDPEEMKKRGLFFPSFRSALERAYAKIVKLTPRVAEGFQDLDDFLAHSDPLGRRELFRSLTEGQDAASVRRLSASFYVLEGYFQNQSTQRLGALVGEALLQDDPAREDSITRAVKESQAHLFEASFFGMKAGGYGIPLIGELPTLGSPVVNSRQSAESESFAAQVQNWLRQRFSSQETELDQIAANRRIFSERLK